MKCPKCDYIGFEPSDRCRNCGYEFSLSRRDPPSDLSLRPGEAAAPLADFDLGEAVRPASRTPPGQRRALDPSLDPGVGPDWPAADLPLFEGDAADDPLLVVGGAPAPPLAVRRSTPAIRRDRPRMTPRVPQPDMLAFGAPDTADGRAARSARPEADAGPAPAGVRLSAALLDWLMLAAIDLVVVYFTLRICRLTTAEVGRLPLLPMALFFLLLNGGYLALLTGAGGQTIGKMAFGLKVVGADARPVAMPQALARTLVLLLSALPAGLGLVSILLDRGGRGLHDRLCDTCVVTREATPSPKP